ncbi:MAG TPA: serine/threonine-protein kinase [Thermoanaerobaculia bacterium]
MRFLSDDVVARLRDVTQLPDLTGTRYRLIGELGRGGMSVVYEAEDLALDRRVAVKVVASELAGEAAEHLRDEAKTIAKLEHPGIVPLHEVNVLPDGRTYYVMKLVRGERLDHWARGRAEAEVLRAFIRVCEAVAFAHARGIIHRDLKPANVMVGEFGAVLVMDWGVAMRIGSDDGSRVVAGTLGYMSPEQLRGEPVDARADVYSLGRMLETLIKPMPRRLAAIAARATSDSRDERYADAASLGDDVVSYLDSQPVAAYRETVLERVARFLGRYRTLVALIVAYLVMRTVILLWARL